MKAVLSLLFVIAAQLVTAQSLNFRTDGYYLFDNGQDTLHLIRTDNKQGKEFLSLFSVINPNLGGTIQWAKKSPCLPDNTVATDNSSRFEMFAFFSNTMGISSVAACFNKEVHQQFMVTVGKTKKALSDKNISFLDFAAPDMRIILKKDNRFIIRRGSASVVENGDKQGPRSLPEKLTGTLYSDRIIVERIDFETSNQEFAKILNRYRKYPMVFKFYKFGEIPKTKAPYLVYKEGGLWD